MPFQFRRNSKFALLAIPGIGSDLPDVEYQLSDGTWVMPQMPSVADLDKWKAWIGSIRADGLQRTNLAFLIEEESANPFVLDQIHLRLKDDLALLYYCLQLRSGVESQDPDILLGSCIDGEVLIRQMSRLLPFSQSKGYIAARVSEEWLEEALALRAGIRQGQSQSGGYSRFHRGLDVLFKALREKAQERLHQLVRSLEALILPKAGKTETQFAHRCQTFAIPGTATAAILKEIFGMRSDAEHMHNWDRAVAAYPQDQRDDICWQRTRQVESLARSAYSRLLLDPALRNHFRTDDTIEDFWKLKDHERGTIWGNGLDITSEPLFTQYDQWGRGILGSSGP